MEYTVIGDSVNLAARLESNAKPGQILISHRTWEQVRGRGGDARARHHQGQGQGGAGRGLRGARGCRDSGKRDGDRCDGRRARAALSGGLRGMVGGGLRVGAAGRPSALAPSPRRRRPCAPRRPLRPPPLPEAFESDDFVITVAKAGDTPGDPGRALPGRRGQGVDDRGLRRRAGARARSGGRDSTAALEPRPASRRRATRSCPSSVTTTSATGVQGTAGPGRRQVRGADALPQDQGLPRGRAWASSSSSRGSADNCRSDPWSSPSTTATSRSSSTRIRC